MSKADQARHLAEEAKGRLKKNIGDATDNPRMEAEGRAETLAAEAKQAGDKVKDAAREVADEGEDAVDRMRDQDR